MFCLALPARAADELAQRVVIVCNEREPASHPLAEYYAGRRGVPTNQICRISARASETISRREFNEQIREPLLRFLTRNRLLQQEPRTIFDSVLGKLPWLETVRSEVSFIVLMYGVPLRIESDPSVTETLPENTPKEFHRNEASVESELALLPSVGLPVSGPLRNPFFDSAAPRFGAPLNRQMLLVGRLDGPDPQSVRRMIDEALTAEQYGLHGRAYFDAQGTREKGYVEGDNWIRAACRAVREAGYECELDERLPTFDEHYAMTDVAIYAGWYSGHVTGPFRQDAFRFRRGAIPYHIHSASGASVRSAVSYWVGPMLAKGAAATMGNVWEPYLSMTPHVEKFFRRLLDGATFLEACYHSQPVLSWQTTFVGDPLYRPFAVSVDEQIARLEAGQLPDLEWAYLRKVNLLLTRNQLAGAEALCRAKAEALSSVVLYEKLGDLLRITHRNAEAAQAYKKAMQSTQNSHRSVRVAEKLASAYEADGQATLALAVYEALAAAHPATNKVVEFYTKARDLAAASGQPARADIFQAKIDGLLRAKDAHKKK